MRIKHSSEFDPYKNLRDKNQLTIDVTLLDEDEDSTRTEFFFNSEKMGYGVEDEKREVKIPGETRVDNGTYAGDFRYSPKFSKHYYRDSDGNIIKASKRNTPELIEKYHTQHELFWVKDTPRHEFVLWHWGNTDDDTDACYCVGSFPTVMNGQKAVGASRKKYEEIYPIMWRAFHKEDKQITVNYNR